MPIPVQKPGRSKQDYGTPDDFLAAVRAKFGELVVDLAASAENAVCERYYSEADDSLQQMWAAHGNMWLNPPFAKITPWVKKASETPLIRGSRILVLVPAAVGSNWWRDYVHGKATVLLLNGRLQFKGATGLYPKDCVLLVYDAYKPGLASYAPWTWKKDVPVAPQTEA